MAFTANSLAEFFCEKISKTTLLYSRKTTFESTFTWKTLSVKWLWKLMNFPYQILELELESLFYKGWDDVP